MFVDLDISVVRKHKHEHLEIHGKFEERGQGKTKRLIPEHDIIGERTLSTFS